MMKSKSLSRCACGRMKQRTSFQCAGCRPKVTKTARRRAVPQPRLPFVGPRVMARTVRKKLPVPAPVIPKYVSQRVILQHDPIASRYSWASILSVVSR